MLFRHNTDNYNIFYLFVYIYLYVCMYIVLVSGVVIIIHMSVVFCWTRVTIQNERWSVSQTGWRASDISIKYLWASNRYHGSCSWEHSIDPEWRCFAMHFSFHASIPGFIPVQTVFGDHLIHSGYCVLKSDRKPFTIFSAGLTSKTICFSSEGRILFRIWGAFSSVRSVFSTF